MMSCLMAPNASRSPALDDTQTLWASNTSSAVRMSTNVRSISSSRFLTIDRLSCRSTLNPRCGTALLLISLATFGCLFRREGSAAGGSDILISLHAAIILSVDPGDHRFVILNLPECCSQLPLHSSSPDQLVPLKQILS